jgi:hypothetical protein
MLRDVFCIRVSNQTTSPQRAKSAPKGWKAVKNGDKKSPIPAGNRPFLTISINY